MCPTLVLGPGRLEHEIACTGEQSGEGTRGQRQGFTGGFTSQKEVGG